MAKAEEDEQYIKKSVQAIAKLAETYRELEKTGSLREDQTIRFVTNILEEASELGRRGILKDPVSLAIFRSSGKFQLVWDAVINNIAAEVKALDQGKSKSLSLLEESIKRAEVLGVDKDPKINIYLAQMRRKYPIKETEAKLTQKELIMVRNLGEIPNFSLESIPLETGSGEKIKGDNFIGFVLPRAKTEVVDDRAGLVLTDGTKVFLGADGVSESYVGGIAAREIIRKVQDDLEHFLLDLGNIFNNPGGILASWGIIMKMRQEIVLNHYKTNIENNSNVSLVYKTAMADLTKRGSDTTFYLVAVSSQGEVRFLSVGDSVIEKITKDQSVEDLIPVEIASPDGLFSTVHGFRGNYRVGSTRLEKGEVLIFGTDGIKKNLRNLRTAFSEKNKWPEKLDQVGDDLTIFAYSFS